MKLRLRRKLAQLRQRFVLTGEEKRVILFILMAFTLGLGAKYYRATHPTPPPAVDPKHPSTKQALASPSTTAPRTRGRKSHSPKPGATSAIEVETPGSTPRPRR